MSSPDAVASEIGCAHCGLPVPPARRERGREPAFCCGGCATVHALLTSWKLDRYYALRRASGAEPRPARTTGRPFTEMDDASYQTAFCPDLPDGSREVEWILEGVHCSACVWLVERLPRLVDGVLDARVDLTRGRARVRWDPERARLSAVASTLDRLGYTPHVVRGGRTEELRRAEDRRMLVRLGVAGASAANVMAIAFALYGGGVHGIEAELATFFRWASLVIALPALVVGGGVFFRGALASLRAGRLHMDVPVALGLAAGFLYGTVNTVRGRGEIYFDSLTALIFLLLAGRFVQQRRQRAAGEAAEVLAALTPRTARLLEGTATRDVPATSLIPGMLVEVRSGEMLPVDGIVAAGRSSLDVSLLTGESRPIPVEPEDPVHAGTTNRGARIVVRTTATGESTRLARLTRLVEDHVGRRPRTVQIADRIAGAFVATVVVCAIATALFWWTVEPTRALDNAIALLVVSCPCALGLATPLAFSAAIGRAARAGILIKGGDVLERLSRPSRMWLDKTGTLTEGRMAVLEWAGDPAIAPLVAALERDSSHPAARALAETPGEFPRLEAADVLETPGCGIEGTVDGRRLRIGSREFVAARCGPLSTELAEAFDRWSERGATCIVVGVDDRSAAVAALGDRLRPDAGPALDRIRALGWRVGILSGDHPDVVAAVARILAIGPDDARGGVDPEAKLAAVREGDVMVGDGVNDAAALVAAEVGIGVHGGAEAALESADVYVTRPGVAAVADLLVGARRTMAVVRRNLAFSLAYNVVGATLAMAGLVTPLVAAVLMPLSSITVIVSSYRARTFDPLEVA